MVFLNINDKLGLYIYEIPLLSQDAQSISKHKNKMATLSLISRLETRSTHLYVSGQNILFQKQKNAQAI